MIISKKESTKSFLKIESARYFYLVLLILYVEIKLLTEEEIGSLIEKYGNKRSSLIRIMQEIQRKAGYLPKEDLIALSRQVNVPLSKIYGIATFYHQFRLKPFGRHVIQVCFGTACHVKGNDEIWAFLREKLKLIASEDTTNDLLFTIQKTRCFGACSIAPVIKIDNDIYGNITKEKLEEILKKYS